MTPLYLYALLREHPKALPPAGVAGERLRVVAAGRVLAIVGELLVAPPLEAGVVRAQDQLVSRVAAGVRAILPARFGCLVSGPDRLSEALARAEPVLLEALTLVEGCDQMIVRVATAGRRAPGAGPAPEPERSRSLPAGPGAGTRYLLARLRVQQAAAGVPALRQLDARLAPLVRARRVERHRTPPLVASVYHLVRRVDAVRYARALAGARALAPGLRLTVTGPYAPYAFAPEVLG